MRFLDKKYLIFYAIISVALFVVLSPASNVKINNLLAGLTQQLIVQEVNPVRESYGFLDLNVNEKLTQAAYLKAQDMIERGYFDHVGPEGELPWTWLDLVEYDYAAAGENLAIDFSDPIMLLNAWLNSPSHAKNILNGYFTDIGIGIAEGGMNGRETIVVVMFLGREKTASLAMASNITDEYKEIIISEIDKSSKPAYLDVTEEELIKDVDPEDSVIIKTVDENELYKENLFLAITEKGSDIGQKRQSDTDITVFQMFLLSDSPQLIRLFLTVLYAGLAILAFVGMIARRKRETAVIFQSIFILLLTIFIWLPDII
ncbi:CAP domain-containing protein [Patescibacteria group bacterium]|nr:CAP domain-containing protein [Patescibacteria group bacterium]